MPEEICLAFHLIAELGIADGVAPMSKHEGLWYRKLDENWEIAVNGHREAILSQSDVNRIACTVEPFRAAVWWNGWLEGFIDPYGGVIAAGELANEETLVAALRKAIEKAEAGSGRTE